MKWLARALLASSLVVAQGCSSVVETEPETDAAEVRSTDGISLEAVLPELAARGITATVRKLVDPRFAKIDEVENRYYLAVSFGKITEDHFKTIRALFAGHSKVNYDAQRSYELTDFLHPAMQAVVNQTFRVDSFSGMEILSKAPDSLPDASPINELARNGVAIETNCFNTTTELLHQLAPGHQTTDFLLFIPDREFANDWFNRPDYSDEVAVSDLRFGDVLVVNQRQEDLGNEPFVAHTAFVLSKELLFEKTNASSDDPYRVSLRKDVLSLYARIPTELHYRRFHGAGKKALPAQPLPTNEIDAASKIIIHKAHPSLNADNIALTRDFGMGGNFATSAHEIQPAKVVINPTTGRGILAADRAVLARFVALQGT